MNDMQKKLSKSGFSYNKDNEKGNKDGMNKENKENWNNNRNKDLTFITPIEAREWHKEYCNEIKKENYWNEEARVNKKCFDEYPRALAFTFVTTGCKLTQLRKFYLAIERIERSIQLGKDISKYQSDLYMLCCYAYNKQKTVGVSEEFYNFIDVNIKGITTNEELSIFKKHFEAILCYIPKDKGDN